MFRKSGKGGLVLALLLAGWIAFNCIDEVPRYDASLLLPRVDIPDEQNGYAVLRYLNVNDGQDVLLSKDDSQKLRKVIGEWEWDRPFAERVIEKNLAVIDQIKQVVSRPRFKTDYPATVYSAVPHGSLLQIGRIVLLKARLDEDKGSYDDAIKSANLAINYCEKIRQDELGSVLSYVIGWACINDVVDFYHELVSNHEISEDNLILIESGLNAVYPYESDNFDRALKGEFSRIKYFSEWYKYYGLEKRWGIINDALEKKWGIINDALEKKTFCFSCTISIVEVLFGHFNALLPRYYWHPNKRLNIISEYFLNDIRYASGTCSVLDKSVFYSSLQHEWTDEHSLKDLFLPGVAGDSWFNGTNEDYVLRRCEYYNYYSAVKSIVAMKRYKAAKGEYPQALQQMVPDYLKVVPIDYFGNAGLQYDFKNSRLYSAGMNHDNNASSNLGLSRGKCVHYKKKSNDNCDISPTFPINWNDYKFYEKLNAAEAGDMNAQRLLGWMYHFGKYTEIDPEKAVYWYTKAAEQHDAHAEYLLGALYQVKGSHCSNPGPTAALEDEKKAFDWFRKSYEHGSPYGGNGYAGYLISGNAGVSDAQQAFRILTQQAISKNIDYDEGLLYALRNYWLSGVDESMLVSAWADYYLQHPDLLVGFSGEKKTGEQFMHQLLADNLWQQAYQYGTSTPEERKRLDEWSTTLHSHYSAAHDEDGIKQLDEYIAERIKPTAEEKPEQRDLCKLVFDHRHEDMAKFQAVQQQIFHDKKKAKSLVKSFDKEMAEKYSESGMLANGALELDFLAMNVKSLLGLIFDFSNLDSRDEALRFDDGISEVGIMIYGDHFHPAVAANLLLADLGLGAECTDGKVRITVEDATKLKPKLLTENFITDWSGVEYRNGNLEGAGSITYAYGFKYKGDVVNGLPNGNGAYILGSDVLSGNGFVNGLLNGDGITVENGHPVERGEYKNNVLYGKGAYAYGYSGAVYEGDFKKGSGEGVVTYYDVGDLNTFHMPLDHTYSPIWSFSGVFKEEQKTIGTCSIYRDRKVVDSFACEFSEGALVKVGSVSLLPPG